MIFFDLTQLLMDSQFVFFILIGIIILNYFFEQIIDFLNFKTYDKSLPDLMSDVYDNEKYLKNQEYNKAKARFSFYTSAFSFILILLMLLFDGFAFVDNLVSDVTNNESVITLLFFGVLFLASEILTLPFSIYNTFVIEEKFGFNKTKTSTFIFDKLKTWMLAVVIGGLLLFAISQAYMHTDAWFVPLVFALISVFMIFMSMFYTVLIVPMFNKLSVLPEGELRNSINDLALKLDFPLADISIMDSSKRSSKSNAYFSGFGKKRKIVLFDTLIEKHTVEELVAILAHEIAHYKKKHVLTGMLLSLLQTGIMLTLLYLFLQLPNFQFALGVEKTSLHIGLLVFALLFTPFSIITNFVTSYISRKNEYSADEFAAKNYSALHLQNALKKLSSDNLSHLNPHPFYVKVYYSHPPVIERLKALDKFKI